VLLDQADRAVRVELRLDQRGPALEQGGEQDLVQRRGMEQRRGHQGHLVTADIDVHQQVVHVPDDVPVGEHDPLGTSGRAGGVLDHEQVIMTDRLVERRRALRPQPAPPWRPAPAHDIDRQPLHLRRAGDVIEARRRDQQLRAAVGQDVRRLRRRQPGVQRDEHGPQLRRREHRLDQLDRVEPQESHPVTAADAAGRQPVRQPGRVLGQLRVGPDLTGTDEGRVAGGHPRPPGRPRAESLIPHGHVSVVDSSARAGHSSRDSSVTSGSCARPRSTVTASRPARSAATPQMI
jgi:hypothetical protein